MLLRFSLYGLLKNQRYFEAFLVLALLDRGLSFTQIGVLVAVKELTLNLFEVPSGVVADLLGRRRSILISSAAYVVAYALLGGSEHVAVLVVAMALVGFGDAFRSGTHKAIIFDWLAAEGRSSERIRVYGLTRSWAQLGSAIAVPVGVATVLVSDGYTLAFWASTVPAVANVVLVASYPRALEGPRHTGASLREATRSLLAITRRALSGAAVRRLLVESTAMGGLNRATKDYLQPLLEHSALLVPWLVGRSDAMRAAVLVGGIYSVLFLFSALAAYRSHWVVERLGELERASRWLWCVVAVAYSAMLLGLLLPRESLAIAAFVLVALVHNVFRPVLIDRFDDHTPPEVGATILSVESQAVSLGAAALAPLLGYAIDQATASSGPGVQGLWPIAAVGVLVSLAILLTGRRSTPALPEAR